MSTLRHATYANKPERKKKVRCGDVMWALTTKHTPLVGVWIQRGERQTTVPDSQSYEYTIEWHCRLYTRFYSAVHVAVNIYKQQLCTKNRNSRDNAQMTTHSPCNKKASATISLFLVNAGFVLPTNVVPQLLFTQTTLSQNHFQQPEYRSVFFFLWIFWPQLLTHDVFTGLYWSRNLRGRQTAA